MFEKYLLIKSTLNTHHKIFRTYHILLRLMKQTIWVWIRYVDLLQFFRYYVSVNQKITSKLDINLWFYFNHIYHCNTFSYLHNWNQYWAQFQENLPPHKILIIFILDLPIKMHLIEVTTATTFTTNAVQNTIWRWRHSKKHYMEKFPRMSYTSISCWWNCALINTIRPKILVKTIWNETQCVMYGDFLGSRSHSHSHG